MKTVKWKWRGNPLGVASLVLAACVFTTAAHAQSGTLVQGNSIVHDGLNRFFHYYVPNSITPDAPVVFLLHGGAQSYNQIINASSTSREWLTIADDEGFLLIIPNGVNPDNGNTNGENQNWNDCRADNTVRNSTADDVGFINALIDWADGNFIVDLSRVYATGASNGGLMSYRLAFELSDRIAACAVFIANMPVNSQCFGPVKPVPMFICNGDGETNYMPWNGGFVTQNQGTGAGAVISALATRDFWINHNNTDTTPIQVINWPNIFANDGSTVTSSLYTNGDNGSEVLFYRVNGGGHNQPSINYVIGPLVRLLLGLGNQNRDIEGTRHAWDFLQRHVLITPPEVSCLGPEADLGEIEGCPGDENFSASFPVSYSYEDGAVTATIETASGDVSVDVATVVDPGGDPITVIVDGPSAINFEGPSGLSEFVNVEIHADDGSAAGVVTETCGFSAQLTLVDTTPPVVTSITPTPHTLWPPNHHMVQVSVEVAAEDGCGGEVTVSLLSITSNEPDNGQGDGNTTGDIEIGPDGTIHLRAERQGSGNGRTYTLVYEVSDAAGNSTQAETMVHVPKNAASHNCGNPDCDLN